MNNGSHNCSDALKCLDTVAHLLQSPVTGDSRPRECLRLLAAAPAVLDRQAGRRATLAVTEVPVATLPGTTKVLKRVYICLCLQLLDEQNTPTGAATSEHLLSIRSKRDTTTVFVRFPQSVGDGYVVFCSSGASTAKLCVDTPPKAVMLEIVARGSKADVTISSPGADSASLVSPSTMLADSSIITIGGSKNCVEWASIDTEPVASDNRNRTSWPAPYRGTDKLGDTALNAGSSACCVGSAAPKQLRQLGVIATSPLLGFQSQLSRMLLLPRPQPLYSPYYRLPVPAADTDASAPPMERLMAYVVGEHVLPGLSSPAMAPSAQDLMLLDGRPSNAVIAAGGVARLFLILAGLIARINKETADLEAAQSGQQDPWLPALAPPSTEGAPQAEPDPLDPSDPAVAAMLQRHV